MRQLTFTREDIADPARLERLFQQLNRILLESKAPVAGAPLNLTSLAAQLAPLIRSQLQAPGGSPLNLQSLLPNTGLGIVTENTHANRNSLFPASTTAVGAVYWETDRTTGYVNVETSGVRAWTWFGGTYRAAVASRPVDLVSADAGFRFVNTDTDTNTEYIWTGTEWWTTGGYLQEVVDAVTNAATTVQILRHLTSGTAAANFAARQVWQLENGSGTTFPYGQQDVEIVTATAGAEDGKWRWWLAVAGALVDLMTLSQTGNLQLLLGDYVWQSGTANTGTLTHGNTGNRSYGFPDDNGSMVYTAVTLTANNFVLGAGTQQVKDATFSVVPVANGGTGVAYDRIAATVALTAQVATVGPTTAASAGSQFRFSYTLLITTTDVGAATVTVSVNYTDDIGATSQAGAALAVVANNRQTGTFIIQRASGNVTYTVTVTGAIGTAVFAFYATLERLS